MKLDSNLPEPHETNQSLKRLGYEMVKPIKIDQRHDVYFCQKDEVSYVVKHAKNEESFNQLKKEVIANTFIKGLLSEDSPFTVPSSRIIETDDELFCEHEYLKGRVMATQEPSQIQVEPGKEVLKQLVEVIRFYSNLNVNSVPAELKLQGLEQELWEQKITKMRNKVTPLLDAGVSKKDFERLIDQYQSFPYKKSFLHHDFMLPNIIKLKDGGLGLIDAEFTGEGMKWYDIAYFYLQTYTFLKRPDLASSFLHTALEKFHEIDDETDIDTQIFHPLSYRVVFNLNETDFGSEERWLAVEVFNKILTNDISKLL